MRWFKHLTASSRDEKHLAVLSRLGPEGYGVYWLILEMIASQMDASQRTNCTLSVKEWARHCRVSVKKLQKYLRVLENPLGHSPDKSLLCVKGNLELIEIGCPNLSKYRDEYTLKRQRKSGHTPDIKGSGQSPDNVLLQLEAEAEAEAEAERGKTSSSCMVASDEGDPAEQEDPNVLTFECNGPVSEWHLYPSKLKEWQETYADVDVLYECKKARQWTRDNQRKTAKGMTRFLGAWLRDANDKNRGPPKIERCFYAKDEDVVAHSPTTEDLEDVGPYLGGSA